MSVRMPPLPSAVPLSAPRDGVESFFDTAFRRLGRWYLHALVAATVAIVTIITVPIEDFTQVPLLTGRGFHRWDYVVPFVLISLVTGPLIVPTMIFIRHRLLFDMQRGKFDPDHAAEVWHEAVTKVPSTAVLTTLVWSTFINFGGVAWVALREGFGVSTFIAAMVAQLLMTLGSGASCFMLYELACLPFARVVAPHLPADFVPDTGLTVRRRWVLVTTAITVSIGCEAPGFVLGFDDRQARIWAAIFGTLGLVSTFIGLLLALASFSVTRRVDELAFSLSRLGQSAEPLRVYPSSGDEFDGVGRALNRTVDLLDRQAAVLQASRARLVRVADETRRRTERDLHDGAQQHLALVSLKLGLLARRAGDRPDVAAAVARMRTDLAEALDELRTLAHGIFPVALEHEGLRGALLAAGRQSPTPVEYEAPDDLDRWPREVEAALYFCCWELMQAASRTGEAGGPVRLKLAERNGVARFTLRAPEPPEGEVDHTVLYLQDRLGAVGGDVRVERKDGRLKATGRVSLR